MVPVPVTILQRVKTLGNAKQGAGLKTQQNGNCTVETVM